MHEVTLAVTCGSSPLLALLCCSVMGDLASAAKMRQPGVEYAAHYLSTKPLVRVRLQLRPDSPSHKETSGVLKVMVRAAGLTQLCPLTTVPSCRHSLHFEIRKSLFHPLITSAACCGAGLGWCHCRLWLTSAWSLFVRADLPLLCYMDRAEVSRAAQALPSRPVCLTAHPLFPIMSLCCRCLCGAAAVSRAAPSFCHLTSGLPPRRPGASTTTSPQVRHVSTVALKLRICTLLHLLPLLVECC